MKTTYLKKSKTKKFHTGLYWMTVLTSLLYIGWRAFFTLPFGYGTIALVSGILLVLSEAVGIFEALQQFHGMKVNYVPKKPFIDTQLYPDVDVFIATYNESEDLLYKTINGCKHMEYPDPLKVHIYLCDDSNRPHIKALAKKMQIGYLTREEHIDAKAGNLNNALKHTTSPLIATFDADMIPLHNFLMDTVPYFFLSSYQETEAGLWIKKDEEDMKIGFIQAPQSFYNADLFQYYLFSESNVPNEQDYFYRDVQLARNNSNSAIYGGSNTVISREALEAVGGFYTGVITEDFATGISIQAKGYQCYAIGDILAIGLAPTDLKSLIKQRERWARGCIQTLRKVNFMFKKGLHWGQKVSYLSSLLYWYTPFRRLMYILAPILYSVFGILVVKCTLFELLLFWIPYYLFHRIALKVFSNDIRNDRWSNVYDTILFPTLLLPVALETVGIKKKTFSVTTKERLQNDRFYQWKKALPHLLLAGLSIYGIYQSIANCLETNSIYYFIIIFWLIINLYSLIMSSLFMLGRKMYRKSERFMVQVQAKLDFMETSEKGITTDISEGGFSISLKEARYIPPLCQVTLWNDNYQTTMQAELLRVHQKDETWIYGFQIRGLDDVNKEAYYQLIYDRVHTLPQYLEKHSSFFDDLSRNIMLRSKKLYTYPSTSLPCMELWKKIIVDDKEIILKSFDYETCRISGKADYHLNIPITTNLTIHLTSLQDTENDSIYTVENHDELKNSPLFLQLLMKWEGEYKQSLLLQKKHRKALQKGVPQDEFDEPQLYWEV